jgi:hypothetical protein
MLAIPDRLEADRDVRVEDLGGRKLQRERVRLPVRPWDCAISVCCCRDERILGDDHASPPCRPFR